MRIGQSCARSTCRRRLHRAISEIGIPPEQIAGRLRETLLDGSDQKLFDTAVRSCALESFLYRSVNAVLRNRDASRGY